MTLNLRQTSLLTGIMLLLGISTVSGQQVNSLGIFTGLTIPYTFDAGINKDPRYRTKYNVKLLRWEFTLALITKATDSWLILALLKLANILM